jgi:hypothetical protein
MHCFECAKAGTTVAAVAICRHCGVALCFEHLVEADRWSIAGTHEGCRHVVPAVAPAAATGDLVVA